MLAAVVLAALVAGLVLAYRVLFAAPRKALTMQYRPFTLEARTQVSPNTFHYRFGLGDSGAVLGLPVGNHMLLKFRGDDGKDVSRQYTPISSDDDRGHFDLVVKTYPNGLMSQHLARLPVGETVDCRGPLGHLRYLGRGVVSVKRRNPTTRKTEAVEQRVSSISFIAGGTGITPMLQIIRAVLKDVADRTELSLVFANVTEDDILLRDELDRLAERHANFRVHYTLDRPPAGWTGGTGFISAAMIELHLFPPSDDSIALVCGPPPMVRAMEGNLDSLNYTATQRFIY